MSHEGDFVVLASEPSAICGIDVAAPGQARRRGKDGRMPSAEDMLKTFATVFTAHEKQEIRSALNDGTGMHVNDDDAKEEVFRRHWSLKESLVKAMGVGLALELGRAEFHTGGTAGGTRPGAGGGRGGEEAEGSTVETHPQMGERGGENGDGKGNGGGGVPSSIPPSTLPSYSGGGSGGDNEDGGERDGGEESEGNKEEDDAAREMQTTRALQRTMSCSTARIMYSASRKSIFISDGGGDGPRALPGGGNGMETARLILDGAPMPKWRFFMQALGECVPGAGGGQHWVTVSRGPTEDVTDANGGFTATWRKPAFTDEEWEAVLDAPSPFFSTLTIGDLVPEHLKGAYEAAGGDVY